MKFVLLLAILLMWLANPITGGKLFPGFNNPEKWMKRVIRKLQRKTSAYGNMIASNTANISNTAGFISSIAKCESPNINDPDNGLSCCFEDNLNKGQCLCNGMTIDDTSNPGSCCMANQEHPDHCLCSGTDMDDPTNPGNCCFANSGQRLCTGNYTDVPSKRCFNLDWKGDGICDDQNNHGGCNFDGGDCCGDNVDTDLCTQCQCLEEEAPLPNAVGCCYKNQTNPQECLCTGTHLDDPNTPGTCCMDDVNNPGNCFQCNDSTTCNGNGTCIGNTGICECNSGFTGDHCDIVTCPGKPICSGRGACDFSTVTCVCNSGFEGDTCQDIQCPGDGTCSNQGTCDVSNGTCVCNSGFLGDMCQDIDCTGSNPRYVTIAGSCYYIEATTKLKHDEAQLNCQDKLGSSGILFEPRDANTHTLVATAADNIKRTNYWYGINNLADQNQFVYDSDGEDIVEYNLYSGIWYPGQPNGGAHHRCVYGVHWVGGYGYGLLADDGCDSYKILSICQLQNTG